MADQNNHHNVDHVQQVDERRFWKKVTGFAQKAGRTVLEKALVLYYVSKSEHVPKRIKVMIFGALTYFISTIDAIPDIMPVLGFTDDLGILVTVMAAIAAWVSPDIESKVNKKLSEFFKPDSNQAGEKSNSD